MHRWLETTKNTVPVDATSPTVSTESILITATMYAHEGRYGSICDILGEFLSADRDKDVKMALHGSLAELMVNIATQIYRHNVIYEETRPFLCVNLNKELYGCLISAFLFY